MAVRSRFRVGLAACVLAGTSMVAGTLPVGATTTVQVKIVASSSTCSSTFCYKPAKKSIAQGVRVNWSNVTTAPHTVTRCTPTACNGKSGGTGKQKGFGSGTIDAGGTYAFTFLGTGTYRYYCTIHGYGVMHGLISVT
jgi:plastocyanin